MGGEDSTFQLEWARFEPRSDKIKDPNPLPPPFVQFYTDDNALYRYQKLYRPSYPRNCRSNARPWSLQRLL